MKIPVLQTQTRLCLVTHEKELKRTTNTGRLAVHCLANSEVRIRGVKNNPLDLSDLLELPYQPLLLFPGDNSLELNECIIKKFIKPVLLIVPDGNWRQASKVHTRHKELNLVPRVFLKKKNPSSAFLLRKETMEHGMATLEAIAEAFSRLENPIIGKKLKQIYDLKLQQTLLGRGMKLTS